MGLYGVCSLGLLDAALNCLLFDVQCDQHYFLEISFVLKRICFPVAALYYVFSD